MFNMMLRVIVLFTPLLFLQSPNVDASEGAKAWVYNAKEPGLDPFHWEESYHDCGLKGQSPVIILGKEAKKDIALDGLTLINWEKKPDSLCITNNGHSATVAVTGDFRVSGAALPGVFKVAQFHFHWGSSKHRGSEHKLYGQRFPIEMHIVMWNTGYENIGAAVKQSDGLAVIGVMFTMGRYGDKFSDKWPDHKAAFQTIEKALGNIIEPGSSTSMHVTFTLRDLLPNYVYPIFRYHGSLTTPGCFESVTWTILGKPNRVPASFVRALRCLKDSHEKPLVNNYRQIQPLNDRKVTTCCDN